MHMSAVHYLFNLKDMLAFPNDISAAFAYFIRPGCFSGNPKIGGFSCKRHINILKVAARDGCWLRGSVAGLSPGLISARLTINECRR